MNPIICGTTPLRAPSGEPEAILIESVRSGEHDVSYELLHPYERLLFLSARSVLNDDADAEDVVQEAILKAFKALENFRRESKFGAWIVQIAMNDSLDMKPEGGAQGTSSLMCHPHWDR